MITKDQAMTESVFQSVIFKNADGSPLRARRKGRTQTWKTRPAEFRLPVKTGLYLYHQITHQNAADWEVAS
jgi:hypothetical protein